jgi:hypothetical protein
MIDVKVTTGDAEPSVAPHRISNVPGYEPVDVEVTVEHEGTLGQLRLNWRTEERKQGDPPAKLVRREGLVCGLDRCGPRARSLQFEGTFNKVYILDYDEIVAPDGSYVLSFHAKADEVWE